MIAGIEQETAEKKEVKSEKVLALIDRNNELKQWLAASEVERKQYSDANKRLEAEKVSLEKHLLLLSEDEKRFRDEAKNVKFAKGTTSKVIEQRILHLKKEAEELEYSNQKLQDQIDSMMKIQIDTRTQNQKKFDLFGDNDDFDNIVALKAKPRIFGDQE